MHQSASDKIEALSDGYLAELEGAPLAILEVGSQVVEHTQYAIRNAIETRGWRYVGMDIEPGVNVDIAVKDPYDWREVESGAYDAIICNQVMEHVGMPWVTMKEMFRVLKPGGVAFIISPSAGPEHRFPTDCWRIYPDGWKSLAAHVGFHAVEVYTQWKPLYYTDGSDKWQDSCLVAQKPAMPGEAASAIPPLENRHVLEEYAKRRAVRAGAYPLKYKRRALSRHGRAFLKELFGTVRA